MKTVRSSVDLGFDSSKGQLFSFGMKVWTDTTTALGQTKFTITNLCDQNTEIVLTPFYVLLQKKTYTCRVKLNAPTLTLVTGNDLEPVNIVEIECFAIMGCLTDRVDPQGLQGPAGRGLLLDDNGNPDFLGKRLKEAGEPHDDDNAVTKSFLEDQFMPAPMTRRVFSKRVSIQGERIEGLPDPVSEYDAAAMMKADELRAFVATEDQTLTQKIEGEKFKSINTKNMFDLKSLDFSGAENFNVFVFGVERDYTQKYHSSKTHVVCSLSVALVNIGLLKRGKYGVRIEGIIDPKDDESTFDLDVPGVSTALIETRTKYKEKIGLHAIAIDLEIELRVDTANLNSSLNTTHVTEKKLLCLSLEEEVKEMLIHRLLTTSTIMRR